MHSPTAALTANFLGRRRRGRLGLHRDARHSPAAGFLDRLNAVDAVSDLLAVKQAMNDLLRDEKSFLVGWTGSWSEREPLATTITQHPRNLRWSHEWVPFDRNTGQTACEGARLTRMDAPTKGICLGEALLPEADIEFVRVWIRNTRPN